MRLRTSDDVIPMEAIVRVRDACICAVLLSVLLDRHFSVHVLAISTICRYNTGSFNKKTHRFFSLRIRWLHTRRSRHKPQ